MKKIRAGLILISSALMLNACDGHSQKASNEKKKIKK